MPENICILMGLENSFEYWQIEKGIHACNAYKLKKKDFLMRSFLGIIFVLV